MSETTGFGIFLKLCWPNHIRKFPDTLIDKEINYFHKQCSVWWYNLSVTDRKKLEALAVDANLQNLNSPGLPLLDDQTSELSNCESLKTKMNLPMDTFDRNEKEQKCAKVEPYFKFITENWRNAALKVAKSNCDISKVGVIEVEHFLHEMWNSNVSEKSPHFASHESYQDKKTEEARKVLFASLNKDLQKMKPLLAAMSTIPSDEELFAYLEAHSKDPNRIDIIVNELFGHNDTMASPNNKVPPASFQTEVKDPKGKGGKGKKSTNY